MSSRVSSNFEGLKDSPGGSEESLLHAFLEGGPGAAAAFTGLCRLCIPGYLGRLRRHGASQADAQDICQRLFVRLWQSRAKIQVRTSARAYLLTCLRNERITWLREAGRLRRREGVRLDDFDSEDSAILELADRPASPEEEIEEFGREMDRVRLTDCVERSFREFGLRHPERALAVEKQELDGWSIDEIATVLGRSYVATKQFLSTSRKSLREFVRQRCPEGLTNV